MGEPLPYAERPDIIELNPLRLTRLIIVYCARSGGLRRVMLDSVDAVRFDGGVSSGKTHPARLACLDSTGNEIEVVAKFSASCEMKERNLIVEAISALLAFDLTLPVPEPFLVNLSMEFTESIFDAEIKNAVIQSNPIAFGSKHLPPGFALWPPEKRVPKKLLPLALEIFAFDALIQNDDRREENPNCLVRGQEIAIFDHDLAFPPGPILGWKPPWEVGALQHLKRPGAHIFSRSLIRKDLDFTRFADAWNNITDQRLNEYLGAIPEHWNAHIQAANEAIGLIKDVRGNMDGCLNEVRRVLE